MTTYINHEKRARRITIAAVGIRQYKKMQRQMRNPFARAATEAFHNELMHGESSVVLDREANTLKVVPPEAVVSVDHDTKAITVNDNQYVQRTDEDSIVNFVTLIGTGVSTAEIGVRLKTDGFDLSDTQVERRLKKLREAGKIRYDKSAKGWFVVTE